MDRAGSSAEGVKAEHLVHTGLLWMFSVPNFQNRLLRTCFTGWLLLATLRPAYSNAPPFACGNFLAAPAYLLRLIFSPTEEDWQADARLPATPYSMS